MNEDLLTYVDKCRCCYALIEDEAASSQINKIVQFRFGFLIQIEVRKVLQFRCIVSNLLISTAEAVTNAIE